MNICLNCEKEFQAKRSRAKYCSDLCRATFNQNRKGNNGVVSIKIYSLVNPQHNAPFYVGKTSGSLEQRLNSHLKDEININKTQIIKELKSQGVNPIIVLLEEIKCLTEEEEIKALEKEEFWLRKFEAEGFKMSNIAGLKSKLKVRLLSQHAITKTQHLTQPSGVRFNAEDLEFIMNREKIKTVQKVVNFLMNEYCKLYRVEKKSVFHTLQKSETFYKIRGEVDVTNDDENENAGKHIASAQEKIKPKRSFLNYIHLKKECENEEQWNELKLEIALSDLKTSEKKLLIS